MAPKNKKRKETDIHDAKSKRYVNMKERHKVFNEKKKKKADKKKEADKKAKKKKAAKKKGSKKTSKK